MVTCTPTIKTCPLISTVQRIGVYETKARMYVVGSNRTQSRFRVLKIDRTEPQQLVVTDDGVEYSRPQIRQLMRQLDEGNRPRSAGPTGSSQGLVRRVSAFGVVGFVRFTAGYYMIVITQRRRVAMVGPHVIYKIEDTKMIYIPSASRKHSADEQRYVRLFHSVGIGSGFFFSYSYDLTHTLQYNVATPHLCEEQLVDVLGDEFRTSHSTNTTSGDIEKACDWCPLVTHALPADTCQNYESFHTNTDNCVQTSDACDKQAILNAPSRAQSYDQSALSSENSLTYVIGVRDKPSARFTWNKYLLQPVEGQLGWQWQLAIIHGYLGQSLLSLHGRSLLLTLIGRRSCYYAGTRFLKRGSNFAGDVANEVETEQIVADSSVTSLSLGVYSSHVQLRGSVPCHWLQDHSRIPKPPIQIDLNDPFHLTAGKHFNNVMSRYGAPVIVVSLVKKREKRSHESLLHKHLRAAVIYLNRFLPNTVRIKYISFDMARVNKLKQDSVMTRLTEIADSALYETGFFLSITPSSAVRQFISPVHLMTCQVVGSAMRQTGVVRVNCVDCLDRTNTAQFAIGKSALALQLYCMGIVNSRRLPFDSECVTVLEELYEDHGDILALQYGGSQLVHRIRTYRKTTHWGNHGSDIVQTMQRYYSNTFSDSDKQNAINLFLGVFVPGNGASLWSLSSDHHLHLQPAFRDVHSFSLTKWWSDYVLECLPYSADERNKQCDMVVNITTNVTRDVAMVTEQISQSEDAELVDVFSDCYRPSEFSSLSELFIAHAAHSVREGVAISSNVDESPFAVRLRAGRTARSSDSRISSQCSSSAGSGASESERVSSSCDDIEQLTTASVAAAVRRNQQGDERAGCYALAGTVVTADLVGQLLPASRTVYGVQLLPPSRSDLSVHRGHCSIGQMATAVAHGINDRTILLYRPRCLPVLPSCSNRHGCSRAVVAPTVNRRDLEIYGTISTTAEVCVSKCSISTYRRYVISAASHSDLSLCC